MPYARKRKCAETPIVFEGEEPSQNELLKIFSDTSVYEGEVYPLPKGF